MSHGYEYDPRVPRSGPRADYRTGWDENRDNTPKSALMIYLVGAILVCFVFAAMFQVFRERLAPVRRSGNGDDGESSKSKASRKYDYRRVVLRKEHFRKPTGGMDDDTSATRKTSEKEEEENMCDVPTKFPGDNNVEPDVESNTERRKCMQAEDDTPSVGTRDTEDFDDSDWEDNTNNDDADSNAELVLTLRFGRHSKQFQNLCAICLGSYEVDETVVWSTNTTCRHAFHEECVRPVFETGNTKCPLCRSDFVDLEDGAA